MPSLLSFLVSLLLFFSLSLEANDIKIEISYTSDGNLRVQGRHIKGPQKSYQVNFYKQSQFLDKTNTKNDGTFSHIFGPQKGLVAGDHLTVQINDFKGQGQHYRYPDFTIPKKKKQKPQISEREKEIKRLRQLAQKLPEYANQQARTASNRIAESYGRIENWKYNYVKGFLYGKNVRHHQAQREGQTIGREQGKNAGEIDGQNAVGDAPQNRGKQEAQNYFIHEVEKGRIPRPHVPDVNFSTPYFDNKENPVVVSMDETLRIINQDIDRELRSLDYYALSYRGAWIISDIFFGHRKHTYEESYFGAEYVFQNWLNGDYRGIDKNLYRKMRTNFYNLPYDVSNLQETFKQEFKRIVRNVLTDKIDNIVYKNNPMAQSRGQRDGERLGFEKQRQEAHRDAFIEAYVPSAIESYKKTYRQLYQSSYLRTVAYYQSSEVLTTPNVSFYDANRDHLYSPGEAIILQVNEIKNYGGQTATISVGPQQLTIPAYSIVRNKSFNVYTIPEGVSKEANYRQQFRVANDFFNHSYYVGLRKHIDPIYAHLIEEKEDGLWMPGEKISLHIAPINNRSSSLQQLHLSLSSDQANLIDLKEKTLSLTPSGFSKAVVFKNIMEVKADLPLESHGKIHVELSNANGSVATDAAFYFGHRFALKNFHIRLVDGNNDGLFLPGEAIGVVISSLDNIAKRDIELPLILEGEAFSDSQVSQVIKVPAQSALQNQTIKLTTLKDSTPLEEEKEFRVYLGNEKVIIPNNKINRFYVGYKKALQNFEVKLIDSNNDGLFLPGEEVGLEIVSLYNSARSDIELPLILEGNCFESTESSQPQIFKASSGVDHLRVFPMATISDSTNNEENKNFSVFLGKNKVIVPRKGNASFYVGQNKALDNLKIQLLDENCDGIWERGERVDLQISQAKNLSHSPLHFNISFDAPFGKSDSDDYFFELDANASITSNDHLIIEGIGHIPQNADDDVDFRANFTVGGKMLFDSYRLGLDNVLTVFAKNPSNKKSETYLLKKIEEELVAYIKAEGYTGQDWYRRGKRDGTITILQRVADFAFHQRPQRPFKALIPKLENILTKHTSFLRARYRSGFRMHSSKL